MDKLGHLIRTERRKRNLTQQQLADKLSLSRVTLSELETDKIVEIGIRKVERILLFLGYELVAQKQGAMPTLNDLKQKDIFFGDSDD